MWNPFPCSIIFTILNFYLFKLYPIHWLFLSYHTLLNPIHHIMFSGSLSVPSALLLPRWMMMKLEACCHGRTACHSVHPEPLNPPSFCRMYTIARNTYPVWFSPYIIRCEWCNERHYCMFLDEGPYSQTVREYSSELNLNISRLGVI